MHEVLGTAAHGPRARGEIPRATQLPLHRQCDQFSCLGFGLPLSTAYGYWRYATDLLRPLADALLGTVLEDPVWVGIDDTHIDVLDCSKKDGKYRGHLWRFRGSTGLLAYQFTRT